jgi:hypothetical protein
MHMPDIVLAPGVESWLKEHLSRIEAKIRQEAEGIAKAADRAGTIEPLDIAEAAKRYAPGGVIPESRSAPTYQPFWSRVAESISGITLISALLAITFGALGLLGPTPSAQGWLDIAKIFAGAVVGSAGVSVATAARGK